jgi:hypothetical protein
MDISYFFIVVWEWRLQYSFKQVYEIHFKKKEKVGVDEVKKTRDKYKLKKELGKQ